MSCTSCLPNNNIQPPDHVSVPCITPYFHKDTLTPPSSSRSPPLEGGWSPCVCGQRLGLRTLFFFPFPLFYSLIPKMIPYYSCIILFFASLHIILFFLHMSETVGERRRSKRDEHDERSDSLDVAVAEVDEATLPSLPLPLPLASPSIDYCRVRIIVSTCVRHAQNVCARRTHGLAPFLQHFNPLFPNYSFL